MSALTNEEGVARFELGAELAATIVGRSVVECDTEGYDLAYASANSREELDIVLRVHKSGLHFEGRALDADTGKPIPGAAAKVKGMRVEGGGFASFPDEREPVFHGDSEGVIKLDRFSTKDGISVEVTAPGYAKAQEFLSAERPENSIFRLSRAGKIIGKVIRTDGGELPKNLRVTLAMTSGRRSREYLSAEKDGSFSWDHCAAGSYTLSAVSPTEEGRKLICTSEYEAGVKVGQTVEVVIEMEKGILVSGRMIDASTGKPPAERDYAYVRAEGRSYSRIAEDGSWDLYLPAGEHKIMYRCKDMKQQDEFKQLIVEKGKPIKGLIIKVGSASGDDAGKQGTSSGRLRMRSAR